MAETDSESKSSSSPPPNNTPNIIQYPYPPGWISPPPNNTPNIIQYLESLHPPIYHNFIQSCLTNFLRLVLLQLVLQPQAASPPWFHTKPKAAELGAANQKQKKPQLRKRRHPLVRMIWLKKKAQPRRKLLTNVVILQSPSNNQ
ncbi:hypothetical protein H4Q26_011062 [Puccinia striiformis f. sp. tritici PST-130]|uniref:Uncharacterized protein n=1 Tax=Puccinia striiformis f. sp. tritici PST-78 TaxID=1165861 RepID=A0A0L0VXK9_9BASI|nr:hypothetical protein Pst134EB_018628 [Puccinia striiformis f. sp. tritici]KAI9615812.1 hypothetical protein H4Q26_011062 [Puccinia striiformis f. sp. tritici PST-130]KNF03770.1 hypothetical protein PSTG_02864 [Puccinia striiformis f. sp. tritici PST-78]